LLIVGFGASGGVVVARAKPGGARAVGVGKVLRQGGFRVGAPGRCRRPGGSMEVAGEERGQGFAFAGGLIAPDKGFDLSGWQS